MRKKIVAILIILTLAVTMFPFLPENSAYAATKKSNKIAKKITLTVSLNKKTNVAKLKWKKIKKPQNGYAVFRNGKVIARLGTKKITYTDKKLKAGKKYVYQIKTYKKYKKTQWYNKKTKKWQTKQPAKRYRGKKRRITAYKYVNASNKKVVKTKPASNPDSGNTDTPTPPEPLNDEENYANVEIKDEVISDELKSETSYQITFNEEESVTVVINKDEATQSLKKDDLIVLPSNTDNSCGGVALRIDEVKDSGDGNLIIEGSIPELNEVFETIDINIDNDVSGDALERLTVPEYVQIIDNDDNGSIHSKGIHKQDVGIDIPAGGRGFSINYQAKNADGTLSGKVSGTITINKMGLRKEFKTDEYGDVLMCYCDVTPDITANLSLQGTISEKIRIAHGVIITTVPGVEVGVEIFLVLDASGGVTFETNISGSCGPHYSDLTGFNWNDNIKVTNQWTFDLNGELYAQFALEPSFLCMPILKYDFNAGVGGTAKISEYTTEPFICQDLSGYVLFNTEVDPAVGLMKIINSIEGQQLQFRLVILDDNEDNPFRIKGHYEDGVLIESGICTHTFPKGTKFFNGHHYYKRDGIAVDWDLANSYCKYDHKGHLATITSEEELQFIKTFLNNSSSRFYIGGIYSGNQWTWVTGEEWSYDNWAEGQAQTAGSHTIYGDKNYTYMAGSTALWYTIANSNPMAVSGYICEWDY